MPMRLTSRMSAVALYGIPKARLERCIHVFFGLPVSQRIVVHAQQNSNYDSYHDTHDNANHNGDKSSRGNCAILLSICAT